MKLIIGNKTVQIVQDETGELTLGYLVISSIKELTQRLSVHPPQCVVLQVFHFRPAIREKSN